MFETAKHTGSANTVFHYTTTTNRKPLGITEPKLRTKSENDLVDTFPPVVGIAKKSSNTFEGVGPS